MRILKNLKRKIYVIAVMLLAVMVAGCSLVNVNEDKDRKIVIAQVNGEKILKGKLLDEYLRYTSYYNVPAENEKEAKTSILDDLINQQLILQKAKEAGHVVNDEVKAKTADEFDKLIQDYADMLEKAAKDDPNADKNADYPQLAITQYEDYFKSMNMTKEQYLESMALNMVKQDYIDELTVDLTVADSEIKDYYNTELEAQKKAPSNIANSPVAIVTEPEMRRVKHILIKLSDEDSAAIAALRTEKKDTEAVALRDEKLKGIIVKADEVLAKAKDGEDFEALITEFGEDPGMKLEENKDGYVMLRDASMLPEFLEASFKLKEGEISGLVATDYGYHIIKVYEAKDNKIAALDEVNEGIRTTILNNKKNEKSSQLVAEWLKVAKVKKYESRY